MSYTQGIFAAHANQVIDDDIEGKPANTIIACNEKKRIHNLLPTSAPFQ